MLEEGKGLPPPPPTLRKGAGKFGQGQGGRDEGILLDLARNLLKKVLRKQIHTGARRDEQFPLLHRRERKRSMAEIRLSAFKNKKVILRRTPSAFDWRWSWRETKSQSRKAWDQRAGNHPLKLRKEAGHKPE